MHVDIQQDTYHKHQYSVFRRKYQLVIDIILQINS